jgi:hypothetical protein
MSFSKMITDTIGFISDAAAVIFSTDLGDHPPAGIQPFTGEINRRRRSN